MIINMEIMRDKLVLKIIRHAHGFKDIKFKIIREEYSTSSPCFPIDSTDIVISPTIEKANSTLNMIINNISSDFFKLVSRENVGAFQSVSFLYNDPRRIDYDKKI